MTNQTKKFQLGPEGKEYWFAFNERGEMLRAKNGVGRHFKTQQAAARAS